MNHSATGSDNHHEFRQIGILVARCGCNGHAHRDISEGRLEIWSQEEYIEARFRGRTVCLADPQVRVWVNGLWQKVLEEWYQEVVNPPGKRPGMEDRPLSKMVAALREKKGKPLSGADLIAIEALRRWEDGKNWPELYEWIRNVSGSPEQLREVRDLIGKVWAARAPARSSVGSSEFAE